MSGTELGGPVTRVASHGTARGGTSAGPSGTRAKLLEAKEHLSAAFGIIDDVAPELDEPERGALVGIMGSRHEISRIIRQLSNIATMLGTNREGSA